ncbi:MAG: nucleotidyltransferase family protein [Ignavibacteriaceae bacterium]|nr:nucleotidyltransferase family protein [Ignavibacteriaceae bacterium]
MKGVLLAAGKGERLKNITELIPKPMILYKGKPVLEYNIELCRKSGITDLYINTFHLAEKITSYFKNGSQFGVNITYSHEKELFGTAGALNSFKEHLTEPFFVIYGDQVSDYNLELLEKKFNETKAIGVIGFHYRKETIHSGVAEFDKDSRITRFVEKPKPGESDSHWVNAGIYFLSPRIFDYINHGYADFGKDIFPDLLKANVPIYGVCENIPVKVFDTPEMYRENIK